MIRNVLRNALAVGVSVALALPSGVAYASNDATTTPAGADSAALVNAGEDAANQGNAGATGNAGIGGGSTNAAGSTDAQASDQAKEPAVAPSADLAGADAVVARMSLQEKLAQMMVVAMRTWDGSNVTDLNANPKLAEALRKHPYGGVILFGQNVLGNEQLAKLVEQLNSNNADATTGVHVPYLVAVDEEGGVVTRLVGGTRMTGNMAIGATGPAAAKNARDTGRVIGEELAALGINTDFAPSIDVNSNPANPVIGTRSFSDDPEVVALLGNQFIAGMDETGTIATLKHFPGHGDVSSDSHLGLTASQKTLAELESSDLVPFRSAINNGAELIMTAHIALPNYDDAVTLPDGTQGYYPATMSKKVITDLLRNQMGFGGVVVADALEMGAITDKDHPLVDGEVGTATYAANIAEKVINAGVDILLIPSDLKNEAAIDFYDEYLDLLEAKVNDGTIPLARIDESVARILTLKENNGFLAEPTPAGDVSVVGSEAHHAREMEIAQDAITLVKNDDYTLPASGHDANVVFMGRLKGDNVAIDYAVKQLQAADLIDNDAYVNNLSTGKATGSSDAKSKITIDYYSDTQDGKQTLRYTDELSKAIAEADYVVCFTASFNSQPLASSSPLYQGVSRAMTQAHEAGAKFVLMANNLPYDAARYQDADAIVLSYMSSALDTDPAARADGSANMGAINANVQAALRSLFDDLSPIGTLPVNIPALVQNADGTVSFTSDVLYARGHGLQYAYRFTDGAGAKHTAGSGQNLSFKNNARHDLLSGLQVDGKTLEADSYEVAKGSTIITLKSAYLDSLAAGDHKLTASYDYANRGVKTVETTFSTAAKTPAANTGTTTTRTTAATTASSTPATGDATPGVLGFAMAAVAVLGLGATMRARGRREE